MKRMVEVARRSRLIWLPLVISLGLVAIVGTGDAVDNEADIIIRNFDNQEYIVRLYRCGDLVNHISQLDVEDNNPLIPDPDSSDVFDDVGLGCFQVSIFRRGSTDAQDTTPQFFIDDEDEDECWSINDNGRLRDCD